MKNIFLVIVLGLTLTACSQNPHVLGRNQGNPPAPSLGPDSSLPEQGGKEDKTDGKKDCVDVMVSRSFVTRAISSEELANVSQDAQFAMDVMLPPPSIIREIQSATLKLEMAPSASSSTSFCLVERGACYDLAASKKSGTLDLLGLIGAGSFANTIYANPTLHWYSNTAGAVTKATLTINTLESRCTYDPAPIDPGKKDDGKSL